MRPRLRTAWAQAAQVAALVWHGFWIGLGICLAALAVLVSLSGLVRAETIPADAARYRADLTRCARVAWGMDAPVATFAAQIHQESRWRASARSPVGALGMAQFMPATSRWIAGLVPDLADNRPFNPGWALRALTAYDKWLWDRVTAADDCHRMAMTLSAYNGGLGWVQRDKRRAEAQGLDPDQWWDHVERVNAGRSAANFRENRGYPRRILLTLDPMYQAAGWGRGGCHE